MPEEMMMNGIKTMMADMEDMMSILENNIAAIEQKSKDEGIEFDYLDDMKNMLEKMQEIHDKMKVDAEAEQESNQEEESATTA